jgi:hypothetical protein
MVSYPPLRKRECEVVRERRTRHTPFGGSTKSREVKTCTSSMSSTKASTSEREVSWRRVRGIAIALIAG